MFNVHVILLVPCLFLPGQALSNRRAGRKGTPVPIVAGTGILKAAEVDGQAPLFIDAFYDNTKPVAHIVLNMKSFVTLPTEEDVRRWGPDSQWSCEWEAPKERLAENVKVVRGYTNVDDHAWPNATLEASYRDDSAPLIPGFPQPSPHWSLVISCPTVPGLKGLPSVRLNLMGKSVDGWVYKRYGIPVSESMFVNRDTEFALCTMVNQGDLTTSRYLKPWAQYHLAAGFDQLFIYVEEKNTSWVEDALQHFINEGQVSIVPFYFGNISERKEFIMQGAMENHCLYQAKGKARWLAHIDVDEYFDFMRPNVSMRNYPLPEFPHGKSRDVALVVRSQFWGIVPSSHHVDAPYPCHLNGKSECIYKVGRRSKLIMRPDYIDALFPHFAIKRQGYTEVHPEALTELRLDHFKLCDTLGQGCFGNVEANEDIGRKSFHKHMLEDDSDWYTRCSDMLGVKSTKINTTDKS